MKRRTASEDEKILFKKTVETTRPQVIAKAKAKKPAAKPRPGGSGLDGNTKERLKRGGVRPQASMDLHGLTQNAAHRALLSFLQRSRKSGLRLTLVVTGMGNPKNEGAEWMVAGAPSPSAASRRLEEPTRQYGVLKEMVPRWLNEPEFAGLIAGTAPAHVRHGGAGALYIYLRKPE